MADYGKLVSRGLAAAGLGGAATVATPDQAEAMFLGKGARGADLSALARAQKLAREGSPPSYVHQATGWHQGPDKQWRFEISDAPARFNLPRAGHIYGGEKFDINEAVANANSIADRLKHPELFKAYPELRNVRTFTFPDTEFGGDTSGIMRALPSGRGVLGLNETMKPTEARNVALHELQHRIQRIEGFAPGGSDTDRPVLDAAARQVGSAPTGPGIGGIYNTWKDLRSFDQGRRAMYENYRKLAGEVEARNVERRSGMSREQQAVSYPWMTEDIPYGQQITMPPKDYQPELPLPYRR